MLYSIVVSANHKEAMVKPLGTMMEKLSFYILLLLNLAYECHYSLLTSYIQKVNIEYYFSIAVPL